MDEAIGLAFFSFMMLAVLIFFLAIQVTANRSVVDMREKLEVERARSQEHLLINWLGKNTLLITNTGKETVLRYIYLHINGSRTPTYYKELTPQDASPPPDSWSGPGIPLPEGQSVVIGLWEYAPPKVNLGPGASGKAYVYDDTGREGRKISWFGYPDTIRLEEGVQGYSLFVNMSAGVNNAIGHFLLPANKYYTVCSWIKVLNPRSSKEWELLDLQSVVFWLDPGLGVIARLFNGAIELKPSSRVADPESWNHYCVTEKLIPPGEGGTSGDQTKVFSFLVNGTVVAQVRLDTGQQLEANEMDFPCSGGGMPCGKSYADGVYYDGLFASTTYLSPEEIEELGQGILPEGIVDYSWYSFDAASDTITSVDVVTDLGNIFSVEWRGIPEPLLVAGG